VLHEWFGEAFSPPLPDPCPRCGFAPATMEMSAEIGELAKALAQAQAEIKGAIPVWL
jgi:hypothetical protein